MIPLIDLDRWRAGAREGDRAAVAAETDAALRESGFLLVSGHGVEPELPAAIRAAAKRFFELPAQAKAPYAAPVGGRGWIPIGKEANAFYGLEADVARADLKESLTIGRDYSTGDPSIDAEWFTPNVWPAEVPELQHLCDEYAGRVRAVYDELLDLCSAALGLPETWFRDRARRSPHTFNINRYPPLRETGAALEGQFRVAPHTDWGMLTLLDRQSGYGGLQIQELDGTWSDAPLHKGAFTVNVGDLLSRWTAHRWRSTRHRVLPPPSQSPDEELVSLIMFMEADVDQTVTPVIAAADGQELEPVGYGEYLAERVRAATVSL